MVFLASYTLRLDSMTVCSVFTGQREIRIESSLTRDIIEFNVKPLFELYKWAYSEKTTDNLKYSWRDLEEAMNTSGVRPDEEFDDSPKR